MMQGLVPSTTTAENKLKWGLSFHRAIFLVVIFITSAQVATLVVHLWFQLIFPIFCTATALWSTQKDPINPNKKLWEGLFDYYYVRLVQPKRFLSITGSAYALYKEDQEE